MMNVLVIGAGGVGESICALFDRRKNADEWLGKVVLADYDFEKAKEAAAKQRNKDRFIAEQVDALKKEDLVRLAR